MKPEVTILYVHDADRIGYGRMAAEIVREVESRGITVYDDDGRPEEWRSSANPDGGGPDRHTPPIPTNCLNIMSPRIGSRSALFRSRSYPKPCISALDRWKLASFSNPVRNFVTFA